MRGVSNLERCALFIGVGTNKDMRDSLILGLHTTRKAILKNKHQKRLIELLTMHRLALATDPRDRIYVIASLAGDCRSPPLPIDYNVSTWSVYLQTLKFLFETWGDLDFLAFSGASNNTWQSPVSTRPWKRWSWVPDFWWATFLKNIFEHQSLAGA